MMKAIVLECQANARFHFGEALGAFTESKNNTQKSTSDHPFSDMMWSAIVNVWALKYPESVNDFVDACREGLLRISSAFFCCQSDISSDQMVYFLPKPASLNLAKVSEPKKLKKVKYISKGVFEQGLLPEQWFNTDVCTLLQHNTIVALKSEIDSPRQLFYIETMAKNRARDVSDRKDAFYFQTDVFITPNTHWYMVVDNRLEGEMAQQFEAVLSLLTMFGIGGERTTGCGGLEGFQINDFGIEISENQISSQFEMGLSLIAPQSDENYSDCFYQIIKRGGRYLTSGKSLQMIQMLEEGAVLSSNHSHVGGIVSLNDTPSILRYGLNISIPMPKAYLIDFAE